VLSVEECERAVAGMRKLVCSRCGHEWYPRSPRVPRVCARCKSPYWNRPRVRPAKVEREAVAGENVE